MLLVMELAVETLNQFVVYFGLGVTELFNPLSS